LKVTIVMGVLLLGQIGMWSQSECSNLGFSASFSLLHVVYMRHIVGHFLSHSDVYTER